MSEPTQADFDRTRDQLSGDSDEEIRDLLVNVYTEIENYLLGPNDDGDESFNYFYDRSIRRAFEYIARQACVCEFLDGRPDELCDRCRAIGCDLDDHRAPNCLVQPPEAGAST